MDTKKNIIFALFTTLVIGFLLGFIFPFGGTKPHNFDSCAKLPDSVLLEDATICLTENGEYFEKRSTPTPKDTVTMPLPSAAKSFSTSLSPTESATTPTKTPIPTITSTPSPTPIRQDLYFYPQKHSMTRSYNDGSSRGTVVDSFVEGAPTTTFAQYNSFWQSWVKTCFGFGITEGTNQRIGYTWTSDGSTVISDGYYSAFENIAASNNFQICNDTPTSPGTHIIRIVLNQNRTIMEKSYDNNSATLTYTIAGDMAAPTFDFYGPFKESEGTCLYPVNANDNLTVYSNLKIEVRMDSETWQQFNGMRSCIAGSTGESHTYYVRVTDEAGNTTEKSKQFTLL